MACMYDTYRATQKKNRFFFVDGLGGGRHWCGVGVIVQRVGVGLVRKNLPGFYTPSMGRGQKYLGLRSVKVRA